MPHCAARSDEGCRVKQIVVISGKGGTGKTVVTASFAVLADSQVIVDCDVDAADMHLLLHPTVSETHVFTGLPRAVVEIDKCNRCGQCVEVCRYDAIQMNRAADYAQIDNLSCEGCAVCSYVCPTHAIQMHTHISGEWFVSETEYGPIVHARLGIAEQNSGKLVSIIKQKARVIAEEAGKDYVIVDGPPGIGCPVIASISGATVALVVAEPTVSGIHDMERVIDVAHHFGVRTACVVNKYDINLGNTKKIEHWAEKNNTPVYGRIPYDASVLESVIQGVPIVRYADNEVTASITRIWERCISEG
jgi:MinD superfamily P-loop ATPase